MEKSEMPSRDFDELFFCRDAVVSGSRHSWIGSSHLILRRDHHESGGVDVRRADAGMIRCGRLGNDACDPIFPSGPVTSTVVDGLSEGRDRFEYRLRPLESEGDHREWA